MRVAGRSPQIELALGKLSPTQRIIFDALEKVNRTLGKSALSGEIISALTEEQTNIFKRIYKVPLSQAVKTILISLRTKKLVFITRTERRWHYYAAVSVFSENEKPFVYKPSYRKTFIELIREIIVYYKRAIRVGDIEKYLNEVRPDLKKDFKQFRSAIHRLADEKVVEVVEKVRQDKFGGNYFILPDMDKSLYAEAVPLSWLELVLTAFRELWSIQSENAAANGELPKPVTTEEIKKHLVGKYGKEVIPNFNGAMPYALWVLARVNSRTEIRRIPCGEYSKHLWVPLKVSNEELDLSELPVSDTVKVNSLVRLAVKRLNRPVTMADLAEELEIHPELKIKRKKSINSFLNTQSRCSDVKKVAWLYGEWYFYYGTDRPPSIEGYLSLRKVTVEWESLNALSELNDVENCSVKSIAYGRCKLIKDKIDEVIPLLNKLSNDESLGTEVNSAAENLRKEVELVQIQLNSWFDDNPWVSNLNLPESVRSEVSGLTVEQLWELLQPLYPKAMKVKKVAEISNILSGEIRKVKNPSYKPSFCDGSVETAQYLFDKTDAFTYAGQKWGEHECFMQAVMTRDNLGLLRDVDFVLPALFSDDHNERLIAVSCLAFLQDRKAIQHLFDVCLNDSDGGVRESAIWAYAFVGGDVKKLAAKIKRTEESKKVLEFLERIDQCKWSELWFV